MSGENTVDLNKIASEVITKEIEVFYTHVQKEIGKTLSELKTSFKRYIQNSCKRIRKTKTLLYRDAPVDINDIYVKTSFLYSHNKIGLDELVLKINDDSRFILSATAGAGKSFSAKKLFLSLIENKVGIPIFFELRNLNNTNFGIVESLIELFDSYNIELSEDHFYKLMSKGKFILILDGYDELNTSIRKDVGEEIRSITNKFIKVPIIITTRPDEHLEALTNYTVIKVLSLEKQQAIKLVEKLNYDSKVKTKFIKALDTGLYEKHKDFLSNPLLLTIMLMTYSEIAEIPEKVHIFYEQAFDTLFFRHDALKSMYKREMRSKLPIDDFKKALSIISIKSQLKGQINLTNNTLTEYVRDAKRLSRLTFSNDGFIYDLTKAICLLVNDGLYYTFAHRSFQEYFSAFFVTYFPLKKKYELLIKLLLRSKSDTVLQLAFDMNQNNIEMNLIVPLAEEYIQQYDKAKHDVDKLRICFSSIRAYKGKGESTHCYLLVDETKYWYLLIFVEAAYGKRHKSLKPKYKTACTKKAFQELFGPDNVDIFIELKADNEHILRRAGIIEIQEKRVQFLREVIKRIIKNSREIDDELDAYL